MGDPDFRALNVISSMPRDEFQSEGDEPICPVCGADGLKTYPVFHHMPCAYVGPQYDFALQAEGYVCPKCLRDIVSADPDCEILGTSARCGRCGKEMMLPPAVGAID